MILPFVIVGLIWYMEFAYMPGYGSCSFSCITCQSDSKDHLIEGLVLLLTDNAALGIELMTLCLQVRILSH